MRHMNSRRIAPFAVLVLAVSVAACSRSSDPAASSALAPSSASAPVVAAPDGPAGVSSLQSKDLKVGEGASVAAGQTAVVNYTGWLYDSAAPDNKGKKFDSSLDSGTPFSFAVGAGQVIDGWDRGVPGMKVGGQRRLIIPADLGYGSTGAGSDIPPGATLVFDVELMAIK
jgi:FKBP-type peptidyl-prolyl cis-trans isomerase FkpA